MIELRWIQEGGFSDSLELQYRYQETMEGEDHWEGSIDWSDWKTVYIHDPYPIKTAVVCDPKRKGKFKTDG